MSLHINRHMGVHAHCNETCMQSKWRTRRKLETCMQHRFNAHAVILWTFETIKVCTLCLVILIVRKFRIDVLLPCASSGMCYVTRIRVALMAPTINAGVQQSTPLRTQLRVCGQSLDMSVQRQCYNSNSCIIIRTLTLHNACRCCLVLVQSGIGNN